MLEEAKIERWLVNEIKKLGGIADKFTSPGNPGVADRIVVLRGKVYFIELKAQKGRLSNIQKWQRSRYQKAGAEVRVVQGMDEARAFIEEVRSGI